MAAMLAARQRKTGFLHTAAAIVLSGVIAATKSTFLAGVMLALMPFVTAGSVSRDFFVLGDEPSKRGWLWPMKALLCIPFALCLFLLPKLFLPAGCVWLLGSAVSLFLPERALAGKRTAMYWAAVCAAAIAAMLVMLLERYRAYGDMYEGLSHDIMSLYMNDLTRPQLLYNAYLSGLASLDSERALTLTAWIKLTGLVSLIPEDILSQLESSFRTTIELALPSVVPDLMVKGTMTFALIMTLIRQKKETTPSIPPATAWYMPTGFGIGMGVFLVLSAIQYMTDNDTVAMMTSMMGSVAFWAFAIQGVAMNSAILKKMNTSRTRRKVIAVITVLFIPIIAVLWGIMDQLRDPRGLRKDMRNEDE